MDGESAHGAPPIERLFLTSAKGQNYRHRQFDDVDSLKAEFENCDFSYSLFNRGYFRKAKFRDCDFTGCKFVDCNFRGANFYGCNFDYASFLRCFVEVPNVIANLSLRPNVRRENLQNLRVNAASMGDVAVQRQLVLQEIESSASHYRKILKQEEVYYQEKFSTIASRVPAFLQLIGLGISGLVWGHGEQPWRVLFSAAALWMVASLLVVGVTSKPLAAIGDTLPRTFLFFVGVPGASSTGVMAIDCVLVLLRLLYVGLFISVLMRSIWRR